MSAWIVARAHIDVLVLAGVQFHIPYDEDQYAVPGPARLSAAGADLWAENHRSVGYRYDETTDPDAYPPPIAEVVLDPVAVVKAVDCFVYQSCEHPGWETSRAADYCTRLRAAALAGLPVTVRGGGDRSYPAGYDDAPWGIDQLGQALAGTVRRAAADGAR